MAKKQKQHKELKEFRGNLDAAIREANRLDAKMTMGGGTGLVRTWSNGRDEVSYTPDNAYTSEGTVRVRRGKV